MGAVTEALLQQHAAEKQQQHVVHAERVPQSTGDHLGCAPAARQTHTPPLLQPVIERYQGVRHAGTRGAEPHLGRGVHARVSQVEISIIITFSAKIAGSERSVKSHLNLNFSFQLSSLFLPYSGLIVTKKSKWWRKLVCIFHFWREIAMLNENWDWIWW